MDELIQKGIDRQAGSPTRLHGVRERRRCARYVVLAFLLGGWTGVGAEPQYFATPEEAVSALLESLDADDPGPLVSVLGPEYRDEIIGTDPKASRDNFAALRVNARHFQELQSEGEDRRILIVGAERWPLPVPVVRGDRGWHWDMSAGLEEIVDRRVGRNEIKAIDVLRAYVDAQVRYARVDRDGDGVREFAQRIVSTPGQRDGLYWGAEPGEEVSPFGPLVASARDYVSNRELDDPYFGYYFKVVAHQAEPAVGGRYDYIINGNMIAGFAMVAFPADYGYSGVVSFSVNQAGRVYQKDLGEHGDLIAASIDSFKPDETWVEVED